MDVSVVWPSGAVQEVPGLATGSMVTIEEPSWLIIDDVRPPADGVTTVALSVDVAALGLGGPGSVVGLQVAGQSVEVIADAQGAAAFELPARDLPGAVRVTISVDGRVLPVRPAIDYE